MSTPHRQRSKEGQEFIRARAVEIRRNDPDLPVRLIAQRLGCNPSTVSEALREAGITRVSPVGRRHGRAS